MDSPLWVYKLSTSGSETCRQIISWLSTWIQFPQSFPFDVEDDKNDVQVIIMMVVMIMMIVMIVMIVILLLQ